MLTIVNLEQRVALLRVVRVAITHAEEDGWAWADGVGKNFAVG